MMIPDPSTFTQAANIVTAAAAHPWLSPDWGRLLEVVAKPLAYCWYNRWGWLICVW